MTGDHRIVLTPDGYARIEQELERLRTVDRHEVAERIRDAKQFGEYAENAEYEEAKIAQAFVEGRIMDLRRILQHAQVLREADIPEDEVGIGSTVTVTDLDTDEEWTFRLVGSVESDPDRDLISSESPVGEALLGQRAGGEVSVNVPDGVIRYRVDRVSK